MTPEQHEEYTKEYDKLEGEAQEMIESGKGTVDGKETPEFRKIKTRALHIYRTMTGGSNPDWYQDEEDEPKEGEEGHDE